MPKYIAEIQTSTSLSYLRYNALDDNAAESVLKQLLETIDETIIKTIVMPYKGKNDDKRFPDEYSLSSKPLKRYYAELTTGYPGTEEHIAFYASSLKEAEDHAEICAQMNAESYDFEECDETDYSLSEYIPSKHDIYFDQ